MQHTLDFCKVFDLMLYDNLNWYDTNLLWHLLKGLKNDKRVGLDAILSGNWIELVQTVCHVLKHCCYCPRRNTASGVSRFGVF